MQIITPPCENGFIHERMYEIIPGEHRRNPREWCCRSPPPSPPPPPPTPPPPPPPTPPTPPPPPPPPPSQSYSQQCQDCLMYEGLMGISGDISNCESVCN